jgi:hypothetical protein
VLGVAGVVADAHLDAGGPDLVKQLDQRKVCPEEVRLSAEPGIAGVLRLAERVP